MTSLHSSKVESDARDLESRFTKNGSPCIGIILGSGQSRVLINGNVLKPNESISYKSILEFPVPKVPGHAGELILGTIDDIPVAVLSGRVHFYEGHPMSAVVHAVRVLAHLGMKDAFLTNAAGGIRPDLKTGNLTVLTDHLNLMGTCPMRGWKSTGEEKLYPAMANPYPLWEILEDLRKEMEIPGGTGTYAAMPGPCYETAAETRMLRLLGADVVGMSTAPEAIALRHKGVRCGGISVVSNEAGVEDLDHEHVTAAVEAAGPRLAQLLRAAVIRTHQLQQS
jgi:purine-nucleoside phosphorylase